MVKMEIRGLTVRFSKLKAKRNRDEENLLTSRFAQPSAKLQTAYSEDEKAELERVKIKISDFQTEKTRGAIIRSRARCYEHGEKNSKYFLNLEKLNYRRKHISSLINHNGTRINDPKEILNEERNFFKELYSSRNVDPNSEEFRDFFNVDFQLPKEMASTCEGEITLAECTKALSRMQNYKSPGSDGLTKEFYRAFWDIISTYIVNSFNYAFNTANLSISQRQGIISLIPKKKKDTQYLKNWRPVTLLNVDYKIATKTIALHIEKVLPHLINPTQTGYVKGRFIAIDESIRLILDIMEYTKHKDIPGVAVFLDFEKAFDWVEWNYIQKCLEATNFGPHLRQWVYVLYHNISSCVLNNGHASEPFLLERGIRQGYPLSGMLFVIAIEVLAQKIRRSKMIKGIEVEYNGSQEIKFSQYADDTTALLSDSESVMQLFELLGLFEKILNIWSQRDISVYGKINLVKSLALSKLVFICSVRETLKLFVDEVNNIY